MPHRRAAIPLAPSGEPRELQFVSIPFGEPKVRSGAPEGYPECLLTGLRTLWNSSGVFDLSWIYNLPGLYIN
jgi:hypothetical protein